jgi:hypothetical protein
MITMSALETVVILIALNMNLVNMKKLLAMIIMNARMIHAVVYLDVFTLTILTAASPQINVTMLNVSQVKDALSLILLTAAMTPTNVMISTATRK